VHLTTLARPLRYTTAREGHGLQILEKEKRSNEKIYINILNDGGFGGNGPSHSKRADNQALLQ
jgi:hypothetical protein